jgi:putative transposase
MRASRFTEEQIIGMLKEQEAGAKTTEVCRKHGISAATFYKFKAKYGGMDVSDAPRLNGLPPEKCVNRPFNCGLLSTLFLEPFGKVVALGPTEQVWVAQTGRARLVDR